MNTKHTSSDGAVVVLILGIVLLAVGITQIINLQPSLQEANGFLYQTTSGLESFFGGNSLATHAENIRQTYAGFIILTAIGGLMALIGAIRLAVRQ